MICYNELRVLIMVNFGFGADENGPFELLRVQTECRQLREGFGEPLTPLDGKFDTELFSDFSAKTLEGSFSAVSTPIFASKYSFCSVFRYLQDCHAFAPLETQNLRKFLSNFFRIFRSSIYSIPCRSNCSSLMQHASGCKNMSLGPQNARSENVLLSLPAQQ